MRPNVESKINESVHRSSLLSADVKSTDSSFSVSFGGNLEAVINVDFQFRGEVSAKFDFKFSFNFKIRFSQTIF